MQKNKTIPAQIISGFIKFLTLSIFILVVVVFIIPSLLSIFQGKDIAPVDDSELQLQIINIPEEENAFYDLDKTKDLVDLKNVPKEKKLTFNYLESDEWDQELVGQLLIDNEKVLQHFTSAAAKERFQSPYTDNPSKISSDMPVTPMRNWREASYLSGVKAIYLAKKGQEREALDEAIKSVIIGNAIENSQGLLITHLVGIGIKNSGLDVMQKVISIIPKDSLVLSEYKSKLEGYQAIGNDSPFLIEYFVRKESLESFGDKGSWSEFGLVLRMMTKNSFYFKKNLTNSYSFEFYSQLAREAKKNCSEIQKVSSPLVLPEISNLFEMYFIENVIGKHFIYMPELVLNTVLEKKCATENKLKETILIIDNKE